VTPVPGYPDQPKNDPVTGGGGRSHQGKMLVVGAVEFEDGGPGPGRVRLSQVPHYSAASLHAFLATNLGRDTTAKTDGMLQRSLAPANRSRKAQTATDPSIGVRRTTAQASWRDLLHERMIPDEYYPILVLKILRRAAELPHCHPSQACVSGHSSPSFITTGKARPFVGSASGLNFNQRSGRSTTPDTARRAA
jgi:hypothetical protein